MTERAYIRGPSTGSYHHSKLIKLMQSQDVEHHYVLHDAGEAISAAYCMRRLIKQYGYPLIVCRHYRDVWVCKPGSPRERMPREMVALTQLCAEIGISKSTMSYRMQMCGIVPERVCMSGYITQSEADTIRNFKGRHKG